MRVLLFILAIAIGFSGFSAVGHAFDSTETGAISTECAEHAQQGNEQNNASGESEHICVNCSHCCVSHASLPYMPVAIILPVRDTTYRFTVTAMHDDFISGLKRPPKILSLI